MTRFPISILLLSACTLEPKEDDTSLPPTCEQIQTEFQAESIDIRSCTEAAQCGQELTGTSCGCTRNLVARLDADTTRFYELIGEAGELECDLGLESTCDCPEVRGFLCEDGLCAWDYGTPPAYPDCSSAEGDPFDLDAASIAGDTLLVTVSSGGGCEDHDWTLCWPDGAFAESEPVQARLEILHDDHDDPCDAIISEDLEFDLLPLKAAWIASYAGKSGTIIIKLGGESLTYSF